MVVCRPSGMEGSLKPLQDLHHLGRLSRPTLREHFTCQAAAQPNQC